MKWIGLLALGFLHADAYAWPWGNKEVTRESIEAKLDEKKWPNLKKLPVSEEKVITVNAEPFYRNRYGDQAIEKPIKGIPQNFLGFDTSKGRVIVHLTEERDKALGNIWPGRKMNLTCKPLFIRKMSDGSTQKHCLLEEIVFCGCSGK